MTENEQQDSQENPYVLAMCARMLIYYHLGLNYVDTEDSLRARGTWTRQWGC